jgi:hypothetical protein
MIEDGLKREEMVLLGDASQSCLPSGMFGDVVWELAMKGCLWIYLNPKYLEEYFFSVNVSRYLKSGQHFFDCQGRCVFIS